MAKIELYTKTVCSYCVKAKTFLQQKGLDYVEHNLSEDPSKMIEMAERAPGARTVPQIFINGKHIGGCDELYELSGAGKLDALLAEGDDASSNPKPPNALG